MLRRGVVVGALLAFVVAPALAQESPDTQELLERLKRLEAEVERLRAAEGQSAEEPGEEPAGEEPAGEAPAEEPAGDFQFDPDFNPKPEGFRFDPEAAAKAKAKREEDPDWLTLELPWSTKLRMNGSIRSRGAWRAPASYRIPGTFGRPATADSSDGADNAVMRTRLAFNFDVIEQLEARIEIQDSRQWGDRISLVDAPETHLRKGYIYWKRAFDQPLYIKVGRWAVPRLGDQRMFSDPEFNNVGRSWDGVQIDWRPTSCFTLTAMAANVREGQVFSADTDENDDFWVSGLYASWRPIRNHELEAYFFWRHLSDRVFAAERSTRLGDRKDFTLGGRFAGEKCGLDYSIELIMQWGDQAGDRVRAYAGAGRLGYTQPLGEGREVGVHIEYAYASGDRDPTDGQLQTFNPIAPAFVRHHGWMNQVGFSNMHNVEVGFDLRPMRRLSLHVEGHLFWVDKRKDTWFDAFLTPIRRDPSGASRSFLGAELDVYGRYEVLDHLFFLAGYGHFFPQEYVRDSAGGGAGIATQDMGFLFGQVELRF